jgi:hypothetical protein
MRNLNKPRVRRVQSVGGWVWICGLRRINHDELIVSGIGYTPLEAYQSWHRRIYDTFGSTWYIEQIFGWHPVKQELEE